MTWNPPKKAGCMGILFNKEKLGKYTQMKTISNLSELKDIQINQINRKSFMWIRN